MTENSRLSPEEWDKFVASQEPTDIDLSIASTIDQWYPTRRRGVICIVGRVTADPRHGNATICTSEVLRVADDLSWIRTRNRYYRLGRRYEHRSIEQIVDEVLGPGPGVKPLPWTADLGDGRAECPDLPAAEPTPTDDTSQP
ncbi:DUF6634 family protein [Microvirga arabica]|uniref:DUF6634 family protein n=1 Tax=Microvirga arabica TaxID=1128671 RepID=UPI00193A3337|nr:DUF6634 family protein [Microvirga arabica]MBM1170184.1 hypothetical protein [Microvirga arabica]